MLALTLTLRLGHRQSEDFDFFSNQPFKPTSLRESIPYLKHAEMIQFQDNTLTAIVDRNGPVKILLFGPLGIKRVQDPDIIEENGVQVASMLDILASKLKTVQVRAEAKDYQDIVGMLNSGLALAEGLAAAGAIYGKEFNGALSLKALTFFEDGDLPGYLPRSGRHCLGRQLRRLKRASIGCGQAWSREHEVE